MAMLTHQDSPPRPPLINSQIYRNYNNRKVISTCVFSWNQAMSLRCLPWEFGKCCP